MNDFQPLAMDREVRKCAGRWLSFRRALAQGETELANPFVLSRQVCGRRAFNELRQLADDPVAPALSRWVYRFTEQRLNLGVLVGIVERQKRELHPIEEPERTSVSLDGMLERGLCNSDSRRAWLTAMVRHTTDTHHAVAELWERRQELAVRLQLDSPDVVQAPSDALYQLAEQWLDISADLWESPPELRLEQLIQQALAHAANLDWPAHLTPRSLLGFFADSKLFEGLELDPGSLPEGLAPASYLRALARVGSAFLDASAPKDQPFAIAHDAYGLQRRCHGALFGMLPLHPEFLRRKLSANRHQMATAQRALGTSVLIESRLAAFRVLLRRAALAGGQSLRATFEEQSLDACRVALPGNAAGVLIRLHEDDLQRFGGLLLAASRTQEMLNNHDTDWFRNPRAVDQLRSEAALPPASHREQSVFSAGMLALRRWLGEAILQS